MKNVDVLTVMQVVDGIPQFVKEELKAIPQFHKLMSRRRPSKGDSDGRKKHLNNRELLYVKYMADYSESIYRALRGKKRHDKAREDAGLPNNWICDEVVEAAIAKYKEIQLEYTPTVFLLNKLEQGMMLSGKAVEGMLKSMETAMAASDRLTEQMEVVENIAEAKELNDAMLDTSTVVQARIENFMKTTANIPKTQKQIKELQEQVMLEKGGEKAKRGGSYKANREDPK